MQIKNLSALVSAFVFVGVLLTSCASETYLEPEVEKEIIENNTDRKELHTLAFSKVSLSRNNDTINLSVTLAEKQVAVNEFSIPTSPNMEGTEYDFNDGQHAVFNYTGTDVSSVRLAHIDTISEGDRLKVTPHFIVDYSLNGIELSDTLSPWYYQVVPVIAPEVEKADTTYTHNVYVYTREGKEDQPRLYWEVKKLVNGVVYGDPWIYDKVIAKVGVVNNQHFFVPSLGFEKVDESTKEVERTPSQKGNFSEVKTTTLFKFWTRFTASEIAKNDVPLTITESVTFKDGDYELTYRFEGTCTYNKWGEFINKNLDGIYQDGAPEVSPYLGTFTQEIECSLQNPFIIDGGKITIKNLVIENNLYQLK